MDGAGMHRGPSDTGMIQRCFQPAAPKGPTQGSVKNLPRPQRSPAGTSDGSRDGWAPAHQISAKALLTRGEKDTQSPAVPPSARALTVLAAGPGHAGRAAAGARAGLAGAPVQAAAGLAAAPPEGAGRAGWGRMAEVSGTRRCSRAAGAGQQGATGSQAGSRLSCFWQQAFCLLGAKEQRANGLRTSDFHNFISLLWLQT